MNGKQWSLQEQNPNNSILIIFYLEKHSPVSKTMRSVSIKVKDFKERGANIIAKENYKDWAIGSIPVGYRS